VYSLYNSFGMEHKNEYLTRAEVLKTLGLEDKSQPTVYRALKKLEAVGCRRVLIGGGLWRRASLYAALERLAG